MLLSRRHSPLVRPTLSGAGASGFTLIELLAVVAIIAMIMLIAVVGFTNIGRGTAAQKAAENIETTVALARQHAITRNVPVIVLFLDREFYTRNPSCVGYGPTNSQARFYAVFDASNRIYLTGWTELPPGAILDSDYPSTPTQGRNVLRQTSQPDLYGWNQNLPTPGPWIPFPDASSSSTNRMATLPGVAFRTDGSVYVRQNDTPGPRRICVAEGAVDGAGNVIRRPNGARYGVRVSPLGATTREDNP
jgi:prepilin-type N-terminal cleavage/methylation domain-containing protein